LYLSFYFIYYDNILVHFDFCKCVYAISLPFRLALRFEISLNYMYLEMEEKVLPFSFVDFTNKETKIWRHFNRQDEIRYAWFLLCLINRSRKVESHVSVQ